MKSDFDLLTNKTKMISNGEALSDVSSPNRHGISPPPLQLKKKNSGFDTSKASSSAPQAKLPYPIKEKMEHSFGHDFSNVDIHTNSSKASGLQAKAFTHGNQIHFAPGAYKPNEYAGQELLGHELTHVVQQRQKNIPVTTQWKGTGINDNNSLEREADDKGNLAAKGEKVGDHASELKSTNVGQPVVQGFIMGSVSKMINKSKKWAKGGMNFVKNKGKAVFNKGKKLINKTAGSLSILGEIANFFKRAGSAIQDIFSDPIGFIKNLFGGIKEGFLQFFGNITEHLISGLTTWLFKALGNAGISIPKSFSMKSILSMAFQILSTVWEMIKKKLIKIIGKKAVQFGDDVAFVLRKIITVGPVAIWNVFKAKVAQLYK